MAILAVFLTVARKFSRLVWKSKKYGRTLGDLKLEIGLHGGESDI